MPRVHLHNGRITPEREAMVRHAEASLAGKGYTGLEVEENRHGDGVVATAWQGQLRAQALGTTREQAVQELVKVVHRK